MQRTMHPIISTGLVFWAQLCFGWGDLGHEMVGDIAEKNLTPEARRMIFDITGAEPLANVATYPDAVRSSKEHGKFAPFHFAEVPPGKTAQQALADHPTKQNADSVIRVAAAMVPKQNTSLETRKYLLRYLIHVVGDVHQPLHIGNGMDRGANLCKVKFVSPFTGKVENTNLHTVIDTDILHYLKKDFETQNGAAGGNKYYFNYGNAVELAMKQFSLEQIDGFKKMASARFEDWYEESSALHPKVYPDKQPVKTPKDRPYCTFVDEKGKEVVRELDPDQIPVLDEKYSREVLKLVEERILIAGYRLAYLLNQMAEKHKAISKGENPSKDFLENLNIEKLLPSSSNGGRTSSRAPIPSKKSADRKNSSM